MCSVTTFTQPYEPEKKKDHVARVKLSWQVKRGKQILFIGLRTGLCKCHVALKTPTLGNALSRA